MAARTNAAAASGQVTLSAVTISSKYRDIDSKSLMGLLASVNIYESIYTNGVGAAIEIVDSIDLLGTFPIIGEETVFLQFKSAVSEDLVEITLDVLSVSAKSIDKSGITQDYTLTCASRATLRDQLISIDRKFTGAPHEFVESVISNSLNGGKDNLIFPIKQIDETQGNQEIVIPGLTPFGAIQMFSVFAYHRDNPYQIFLFYETLDGFNFRSLSKLFTQEIKHKYIYSMGRATSHWDLEKEGYVRAISMRLGPHADSSKYIFASTFGGKTREVNYYNKTIKDYPSNYLDQAAKIKKLDTTRSESSLIQSKEFIEDYGINPITHMLNTNHINRNLNIQLAPRAIARDIITHANIELTVPGNSELRAGDTVDVNFPRIVSDGAKRYRDKQLSGKYLITRVTHNLSLTSYESTIELIRDSFVEELYNE